MEVFNVSCLVMISIVLFHINSNHVTFQSNNIIIFSKFSCLSVHKILLNNDNIVISSLMSLFCYLKASYSNDSLYTWEAHLIFRGWDVVMFE